MKKKVKVAISIDSDTLQKVDDKIDKVECKNRSHVIEGFIREWLELHDDIWGLIMANENRWEWNYPFSYSKGCISVDWKTLIEKQIESLEKAGLNKIMIAISEDTIDIKTFIESKNYRVNIEYLKVGETTDSWDILVLWKDKLQVKKIIFLLWDNYFHDLNIMDLIYCHNHSVANLTIVVKPEYKSQNFWNIELQWNNISGFREKPSSESEGTHIVNTWVYIINSNIVPEKKKDFKLEYDFFPQYIKKFWAKAYFHNWPWFHIQSDDVVKELGIM